MFPTVDILLIVKDYLTFKSGRREEEKETRVRPFDCKCYRYVFFCFVIPLLFPSEKEHT